MNVKTGDDPSRAIAEDKARHCRARSESVRSELLEGAADSQCGAGGQEADHAQGEDQVGLFGLQRVDTKELGEHQAGRGAVKQGHLSRGGPPARFVGTDAWHGIRGRIVSGRRPGMDPPASRAGTVPPPVTEGERSRAMTGNYAELVDEQAELAELRARVEALESRRVLEVERIDVVEAGGALRMVISNTARAPDPVCDGETFERPGGNAAGLIFYNEEGDECGGLVFAGQCHDTGYSAGAALLFDQFKQDQVVGIMHHEADGGREGGLWVWDRPDEASPSKGGATRLFVGKTRERSSVIELRDAQGRIRLQLAVAGDGTPRLEFLDEAGGVTVSLP